MKFIDIPTEQTTAATDVILFLLGLGAAWFLQRFRKRDAWKVGVWSWLFVLMAVGAGLGAVVHGVVIDEGVKKVLWQPLYLSLAFVVVLAAVGAVYDGWGRTASRRAMLFMAIVPPLFWLATYLGDFTFRAFVFFSVPAMIFSLAVYVMLSLKNGRLNGAAWMAAAMFLTIAAGAIQASGNVFIRVVWSFDHNGVFHIVQASGIVALVVGLWKGIKEDGT